MKRLVAGFLVMASLVACSDDEAPPAAGASADAGVPSPAPSTDRIDAAAIAACPRSDTLLTTADWLTCLAGRRATGTEPFGGTPCELRIGQAGAFEYVRSGAVALSAPPRASWGPSAFGTYQNTGDAFLGGVSPNLPRAAAGPTLQKMNVRFVGRGLADSIEVEYLEESGARGTYACTVDVL